MPPAVKRKPLTKRQQALVEANRGLVGLMVKRFLRRVPDATPYFDDLVQEGMVGLIYAAQMYNPHFLVNGRPVKFSTYACRSIAQKIGLRYGDLAAVIHIPAHARGSAERHAVAVCVGNVSDDLGSWPGNDPDPSGNAVRREHLRLIRAGLAQMTPQQRRVLRHRFGLGRRALTLQQTGNRLGLTKERVRQIEAQALDHLRTELTPPEEWPERLRQKVARAGGR